MEKRMTLVQFLGNLSDSGVKGLLKAAKRLVSVPFLFKCSPKRGIRVPFRGTPSLSRVRGAGRRGSAGGVWGPPGRDLRGDLWAPDGRGEGVGVRMGGSK